MTFKELTIGRTPNGNLAQLLLNGKWLEEIGFTVGTFVTAAYHDSCLTLKTDGLERLEEPVYTFVVTSKKVRNRPRTQLLLDGFLLKKYGMGVGDRVALSLAPNMIQITKINRFALAESA